VTGRDRQRGIGLVNQGISGFFDSMAGPLNRGVNTVMGTNLSETPTADLMDMGGVARRDDPQNLWERALVGTGEAAGSLIPATGIGRAVMQSTGPIARTLQPMFAQFGRAPVVTTGAEMAAGAGAEAAEAATENTENPYVRALAPLAGGMAAGIGAGAIGTAYNQVRPYLPVNMAARGIGRAVAPWTKAGARPIAEDVLRGVSADPDAAADRLAGENLGNLTPAQQTGEPGLMELERGLARRDPAFAQSLDEATTASRTALEGAAREGAQGRTVRDTRTYFQERAEQHNAFIKNLVDKATKRADTALRDVEPTGQPMAQSERVRGIIDKTYDASRAREKALWDKVPKRVQIPTAQARAAYQAALEETTDVSADSIPQKATRFLAEDGGFGEAVTMDRLHRLYSEMRKAAREAMAQNVPDEFRARQATRIADAILADIDAADPMGAARFLEDARAYSSAMNEQFGQGVVGRVTLVPRPTRRWPIFSRRTSRGALCAATG